MARKKAGESITDEVERTLRERTASAEELALQVYGDDTLYYRRCVQDIICRIRKRRKVKVQTTTVYRI